MNREQWSDRTRLMQRISRIFGVLFIFWGLGAIPASAANYEDASSNDDPVSYQAPGSRAKALQVTIVITDGQMTEDQLDYWRKYPESSINGIPILSVPKERSDYRFFE